MTRGIYKRTKDMKTGKHTMSEETKEKLREYHKGKSIFEGYKHTEEWKEEASKRNKGDKNPFFGKKQTRGLHTQTAIKNIKKAMENITHHKNGNHDDNRPRNLMSMNQSEHVSLHWMQGDMR